MGHTNVQFTDEVYMTVYDSARRAITVALEGVLGTNPAQTEDGRVM